MLAQFVDVCQDAAAAVRQSFGPRGAPALVRAFFPTLFDGTPPWLRRAAEARGATVEAVVREFVAEARVGGEWRAELRALYELLRAIPVEADVKNSRIDPDGPEERTLELALRAGPTLDAENGFSHIAQHDSPRAVAGLKLPRPGPVDLLRSGIEIAEALQVHGSVVNDLRQIADYHLLAGQPELAVARIDDALRYAEDKKEIERWVVRARATRAEALRRVLEARRSEMRVAESLTEHKEMDEVASLLRVRR